MNERIRELAEQAGFMVDQSGCIMVCFTSNGDSEAKKFAELILERVIDIVGDGGEFASRPKLIEKIKNEFGVDE